MTHSGVLNILKRRRGSQTSRGLR